MQCAANGARGGICIRVKGPFLTPIELYCTAKIPRSTRCAGDAAVNAHAKNKQMSELRHTQVRCVNHI